MIFQMACIVAASLVFADEVRDNQVTVTGQRIKKNMKDTVVATEVIGRREMEESGAQSAAEALEKHAGVEIYSGIRGRSVRLQGLDTKYVLILINGERLTGRVNDAVDLTRIPADEIERIEIIKGASSALYGSDALAGVVNIITRESTKPAELEAALQYGSGRRVHYGSGNESSASVFSALNTDTVSNHLTVGWHRSDGYDLTPVTQKTRLTEAVGPMLPLFNADEIAQLKGTTGPAFSDLSVADRAELHLLPGFHLGLGFSYRTLDELRKDVSPPRQILDRRNQSHEFSGSVSPRFELSRDTSLRLSAYNSRFFDRLKQDQEGSTELDRHETQDDRLQELRLQLDHRFSSAHLFSTGVDVLAEEFISERIRGRYAYRQRPAFFLQDEWRPASSSSLTLLPGIRYEADSQFGSQTTPKLQARFDPAPHLKLRAGAGAGFRAPSFKDLYLNFQNPGVGYQVKGNPDLKPERSVSSNIGVEFEPGDKLWVSLGVFYNRISNLIDFTRINAPGDLSTFQPANIKQASTAGVEMMIEARMPLNFTGALGYTGMRTRDESQGIPLQGRAEHTAVYRIGYLYRPADLGFSIQGAVHGKQPVWYAREALITAGKGGITLDTGAPVRAALRGQTFSLLETNPDFPQNGYKLRNPYHNLDARVFWTTGVYELFAGARNILDHYEVSLNPQRPRYFYFGLRTHYEAPAGNLHLLPQFESGRPLDKIE